MRQCILEKENKQQVAWIDIDKADKDKFVDLKIDDKLDQNWKIKSVSDVVFSKSWITKRSQDHKNMKKMTDI